MLNEIDIQGKVVCTESTKKINVIIDNTTNETMSLYEFTRWNCLLEAVDIIDQKAKQINNNTSNWVKPIAIQKYIDERTPSMLHEIALDRGVKEAFKPAK
jgi:hypothetical protein